MASPKYKYSLKDISAGDIVSPCEDVFDGDDVFVVVEVVDRGDDSPFSRIDCWDGTSFTIDKIIHLYKNTKAN